MTGDTCTVHEVIPIIFVRFERDPLPVLILQSIADLWVMEMDYFYKISHKSLCNYFRNEPMCYLPKFRIRFSKQKGQSICRDRRDREQEVRSYRKMYEPFMNDTGEARAGGFTQLEVTLWIHARTWTLIKLLSIWLAAQTPCSEHSTVVVTFLSFKFSECVNTWFLTHRSLTKRKKDLYISNACTKYPSNKSGTVLCHLGT